MLHITNGDSAGGSLRESGLAGDVLPWRDMLHAGPVPAGLDLDALRPIRARFLAEDAGLLYDDVLAALEARDAALAGSDAHDEVVLWFEHDLYDQLQLLQILDWFAGRDSGAARLSLICIGAHPDVRPFYGLGQLTPAQLAALFPSRQPVTPAQLALSRAAWAAFRAPDPTGIEAVLAGDTGALPFLAGALERHLEEYPAAGDGLSRTERQILELVAEGHTQPAQLFRASYDREERPFLGDLPFFHVVRELTADPRPLLAGPFLIPAGGEPNDAFRAQELALTADGRAVLAGQADWMALHGIDRWLGGVHLTGHDPARRWDRDARRIVGQG